MLVCGHSPVKLPLATHLRVQPDCMHSFPPGGVTGSIWEETDWMARRRFWQHVRGSWKVTKSNGEEWKRKAKYGDGGFPGKQLWGGWESLGFPSNCWLLPSVSLMVHMAAGAASNCPDFSGTCCLCTWTTVVHYLFYMYFLTHSLLGCAQLGSAAWGMWPLSGAGLSVLCWGLLTG